MIRLLSVACLVLLASPCLAQYATEQSAPRGLGGHYVRVPRAAPQTAVREVAAPRVRERLVIPRAAPQEVRWPWCHRLKYRAASAVMARNAPRMIVRLAPEDVEAYRVEYVAPQEVVAEQPAPQEDVVFVPDEEPVFAAPRDLAPPKSPPVPSPRAVAPPPLKASPRAIVPLKLRPRAVPSPQAEPAGDKAPPPPRAEPAEDPEEMEPAPEGEGGW